MHLSSPIINQVLSASLTSNSYNVAAHRGKADFSLQFIYNESGFGSATLEGTLALHVSNDPRAHPLKALGNPTEYAAAVWRDITASLPGFPSVVLTGSGNDFYVIENLPVSYIRIGFTYVAGSGSLKVYMTGLGEA